jgi:hypothetical protein
MPLTFSSPPSAWTAALNGHAAALSFTRKPIELTPLDHWLHILLPLQIRARSPPSITGAELSKIMTWKLLKGKFRPGLQKYVDALAPASVKAASIISFAALHSGHLRDAIEALTVLKGVGPATATAVLAVISPQTCAFMNDQALEIVLKSRKYTLTEALELTKACANQAKILNKEITKAEKERKSDEGFPLQGGLWTANAVALALWADASVTKTAATTKTTGKNTKTAVATTTTSSKKRKRDK